MRYLAFLIMALMMLSMASCNRITTENGVSEDLAKQRKSEISNIDYQLHFSIPTSIADSVIGKLNASFTLNSKNDVILDFRGNSEMVIGVWQDSKPISYTLTNGHIIIPKQYTIIGRNSFQLDFIAGNSSLNRSNNFLYTLLVPDRASTVFPCFDQPDMKATYTLSLNLPAKWTAISNGKADSINYVSESEKTMYFKQSKPISTYLFAFAAGAFRVETKTVNGKTLSIYHRETDAQKIETNLPLLFDLHSKSLLWLEEYTGIPYPFGKLDLVLIPGFQYSGMEHPGAIFYRDTRLLLDDNPSVTQKLQQANLIAHEVAHQWFGNLVTMRWFNDVWLKEVFAGFMADLMVNPQYPEVNHNLRFLLSHHPRAYSVDRTIGANPIVQDLTNLLFAGTLYGDIIYHKSPIMMQQLELIMGKEPFREGVKEYLNEFSFENASWFDLVNILDKYTHIDLAEWATVWTKETGRPTILYSIDDAAKTIEFNSATNSIVPPMWIDISVTNNPKGSKRIWLDSIPKIVDIDDIDTSNGIIIPNSSHLGYGSFVPDSLNLELLFRKLNTIPDPLARASVHISLYEMFLENFIDFENIFDHTLLSLSTESDPQIQNHLLNQIETIWWRFSPLNSRELLAVSLEATLWELLKTNITTDQKRAVFKTLTNTFTTPESFSKLYSVWADMSFMGINLNENERTKLAYQLMVRKPELYHTIALGELERLDNPDRIAQFEFTLSAVSPNPSERVSFFENLYKPENRKPEPWVIEALHLLHHPLRSDFSLRFIEPSLLMLEEIQKTGDIFFPKNWLDATLSGHSSPEARAIVKDWMSHNMSLSPNLMLKLLQSSDMLFRVEGNTPKLP